MTGSAAASGTTSYTYNTQDELTQEQSARNGSYTDNFGYDSAFNPTTWKGSTQTFNTDNQNSAFVFDGNGNPTSYNGNTLSFDPENRLTAYGSLLTAGYNGDDLRAWKQNSSGRTYFLYDGADPVIEMDGSGNVTAVNTFGAAGLLSRHTSTGSTFYTFDTQGSTVERLDSSQNVLSTNVYDAFGKLLSGTASDPWGYEAQDGYFTDTETGLISLSYRYYDPAQGRFLNRDPIGFSGGINLYSYVGNEPTAWTDGDGLSPSRLSRPPLRANRPCWEIADEIADTAREIHQRAEDMRQDKYREYANPAVDHYDPVTGAYVGSWNGHVQQFEGKQTHLEYLYREYDANGCGGKPGDPIPRMRRIAVNLPVPVPNWVAFATDNDNPPQDVTFGTFIFVAAPVGGIEYLAGKTGVSLGWGALSDAARGWLPNLIRAVGRPAFGH